MGIYREASEQEKEQEGILKIRNLKDGKRKGHAGLICFIDCRKAFHWVNHELLVGCSSSFLLVAKKMNFGKCKCLNTGHRNLDINYNMGDTVLGTTVK